METIDDFVTAILCDDGDVINSCLWEAEGFDTYVYSSAGGNDIIDDGGFVGTLVFSDIASTDVTLSQVGSSLVITNLLTQKTVTVVGEFDPFHGGGMDTITFSDGVSLTSQDVLDQIANSNVIVGTNGAETIKAPAARISSMAVRAMTFSTAETAAILTYSGWDLVTTRSRRPGVPETIGRRQSAARRSRSIQAPQARSAVLRSPKP